MKDRTWELVFLIGIAPLPPRPAFRLEHALGLVGSAAALAAWAYYLRAGLVLSHYDSKAHLVVARRLVDNITPGWQQIGAVWLPLPHLINALPAQSDFLYRTGAFASAVSVVCLGVACWAAARLVIRLTGSVPGAVTATALLASNPNLLYLHATPMTEPLLIAATLVCVLWLYEWVTSDRDEIPTRLGWALFATAWTRYEAWPILAVAIALTAYASGRPRNSVGTAVRDAVRLSLWPATAIVAFVVVSRITVGSWFVTSGFYVPDPLYERQLAKTLLGVWWGTHQLSGYVSEIIAVCAAATVLVMAVRTAGASAAVPAALFAAASLPAFAFYSGHPYRIRYMIPLVAACALWGGLAVGILGRRIRIAGSTLVTVLLLSILFESPPWKAHPPMVDEAEWDRPDASGRRTVTACLAADYHGEKVLASMGSLAHYMQELSNNGFQLADFINEGNGMIWTAVLEAGPAPHAGWMLVEEQAEGGDVLAERIRADAAFARGMQRICEGGGVALYRRVKTGT
jgi:hypothetical protein